MTNLGIRIASSTAEPTGGSIDVLIVDDEPEVRLVLRHLLQARGFVVEVAADEDEARVMEIRHRPRVVLLDLMMPNIDGERFLQFLRMRNSAGTMPVIMLTGSDKRSDLLRCLEAGANDYLRKPVDMDALAARIVVHMSIADRVRELEARLEENTQKSTHYVNN